MNKKNKYILIIPIIAVVIFIVLFLIFNYSETSVLDSSDKEWIQNNSGNLIDIGIINNIPLYSIDGNGVINDYLTFVQEETGLELNKIAYFKEDDQNSEYRFQIVDGDKELTNNQLLVYDDHYVAIGKTKDVIDELKSLDKTTFGVLSKDLSYINYYLKSVDVTLKSYETRTALLKGLDDNEVNMIILPNIMNLDLTIKDDYFVKYYFNEISNKVVFQLSETNIQLNDIFTKTFNAWFNDKYLEDYNKLFLDYYIKQNQVNDKTKADLLSKTYVYGYVENRPYEFYETSNMQGIAIEYLNRIKRLTDIDVDYKEYDNIADLKKDIDNGSVDIYFDYINYPDSKFLKTKSVFNEKYVVLGNGEYVNSLESLKNKKVSMLSNNYLLAYFTDNSMANINTVDYIDDLDLENIVIVDKEVYAYYRNSLFKDLEVLYENSITSEYGFMIKSDNDSFYKLFDNVINTNSYFNYRTVAYENFNKSFFEKLSFEELYLFILAIVLIPLIIIVILYLIFRNRKKVHLLNRENRKRYTDMLTSLKNRNYLNLKIDSWNNNRVYPQAIIVIDLNNTKYINDNYGREKGDNLIVSAASMLINAQLENSEIIRSDGNEFIIYSIGYNENQIDVYCKKLSKSLKDLPYGFGAAIGYSMITDNIKMIDDAINEATIEMQSDKESYK